MTNQEQSSDTSLTQNTLAEFKRDPVAWCQRLINLGLSGNYGNPQKMIAVIGQGSILGLDPYTSLQCIYQVGNQTALMTSMMLALVERSGLLEDKRHQYSGKGDELTCTVWIKRLNRTEQAYSFSIAEARQADLVKPGGGWVKYPSSMLYARAMGFALEREFPEILKGMHSVEELTVEREPQEPLPRDEAPQPEEEKPAAIPAMPKRRRRTKAEMQVARAIQEAIHQKSVAPLPQAEQADVPSPPVPEAEEDDPPVDIDKAIPAEVSSHEELLHKASGAKVSAAEVLEAARVLRVAFEETELIQVPVEKVRRLVQHWPVVLATISRIKAQNLKAAQS